MRMISLIRLSALGAAFLFAFDARAQITPDSVRRIDTVWVKFPGGAGVEGNWQGALNGNGLRIALDVKKTSDGLLSAVLRSLDQGGGPIPVESARQSGDTLRLSIPVINGRYEGVLSSDKSRINGTFSQGTPVRLDLTRVGTAPAAAPIPTPATASPFGLLVNVRIPKVPTPFFSNGKHHLIYELHLDNYANGEVLITKVEVLSGTNTLAAFEGTALMAITKQMRMGAPDDRAIPAGAETVVFVQVLLDSGVAVPASIRHRVTARNGSLETADVPLPSAKPIIIGAPLRGDDWIAANGPGNLSGHRRALIPIAGRAAIAQRFAIDWVRIQPSGGTFTGNALDNKSYRAYSADIYAVADGIISSVKDGIPENVPGENSRAVPINIETIGGNHIVQKVAEGQYAFYAHLIPGSLLVKAGDRVKKGQVIARLGNSGNSTEPHLHFQVMDGPSPLGSEGLPYLIDNWELRGTSGWQARVNQLPMQDARVRFTAGR